MNNKTFWFGFIAVFVVAQVLGFVVHGVLLADAYAPHYGTLFRTEEQMNEMMWMMMAGGAVYLFLFCYIFTKGYEGKGIMEGVRYGTLIGLFMSIPAAIDAYVVYPLSTQIVTTWFVTGVIMFIILGAVFVAIYKPMPRTP